jgi:predicted NAD/FAD-binding protein
MNVAVVGSGIAGMVTARRLFDAGHSVTVYESRARLGGHTATEEVTVNGRSYVVDTGFIVFNERTYPGFCALLQELGVTWTASDMSFSARMEAANVEYNGTSTAALFAQKSNLFRPAFWSMIRGILRFYKEAPGLLLDEGEPGPGPTLGEVLEKGGYSRAFIDWHLVPMACAVWSGVPDEILSFPARSLVRFFANHGFLQVDDRPPWLTVNGGSRAYAKALMAPLLPHVRLSSPVEAVRVLAPGSVEVRADSGTETYDSVVLACHSDQALAMIEDPTQSEQEVLGAIRYQPNRVTLHTDPSLMPKRKAAWAAWNVHVAERQAAQAEPVRVTYWMNSLQSIEGPDDLFVSLNCEHEIDPASVLKDKTFSHPVFDQGAVAAQRRFDEINGVRGLYYCGAYWSFGFHEDGVQSARRALTSMGVDPKLPGRPNELRPNEAGTAAP